ncbi:hypothetical protein A2U01_0054649, partial [Trifolium medium]|nr:hypothetical protein [Trifolium medium]
TVLEHLSQHPIRAGVETSYTTSVYGVPEFQ